MAGWNLLFNRGTSPAPDPTRPDAWNRGRTLVDGLGHCGACHTPRNALGAERGGAAYLAGGEAEGWDAPALTRLSAAPVPWSEKELYAYLRTGASAHHGAAAGPMAPVVDELKALPDADIRAMAAYLASFNDALPPDEAEAKAQAAAAGVPVPAGFSAAARLYDGACATCHEAGRGAVLAGAGQPLGLHTSLHAERPDTFLRAVLAGIERPADGAMPGFAATLDDRQIAELAAYVRARFAPGRPPWQDVAETAARLRAAP